MLHGDNNWEDDMPLFIVTSSWTEQGIKAVKESPKRIDAARALCKKLGAEMKDIYLTSGDSDLLAIVEAPNGDVIAKIAMMLGMGGNLRTRTVRAWTEQEFAKLVSELP
jgi:uncharacterized protein with GYD domain